MSINPLPTAERVILALKGAPMLMTLLIVNLAGLAVVTYLIVASAQFRFAERAAIVDALRECVRNSHPREKL
jgi:hypothetical protein